MITGRVLWLNVIELIFNPKANIVQSLQILFDLLILLEFNLLLIRKHLIFIFKHYLPRLKTTQESGEMEP